MKRRLMLAAVLAIAAVAPLRHGIPAAYAQNIGQRVVNGVVEGPDSALLPGATVFLRNTKTKSIRSFTTQADGKFRFTQVSMSEDFDLWAEKAGKKSASKTISSWDTRKEVDAELKLK